MTNKVLRLRFLHYNDTLFYEPFKPSSFVCEAAAALLISRGGEFEVIAPKCSAAITTFPLIAGIGRTASLMDEEILILGNDEHGTRGRLISIQKPHDGLLAMKYTVQELPLTRLPHQHSSLVSKNLLNVVGGKFKSLAKLSKFTWTDLSLNWKNGTKYLPIFAGACSVKVDEDVHIIFGGERTDLKVSLREVVKINTTEQIVYEMSPMNQSRVCHDCELVNNSVVLVSGGLTKKGDLEERVFQDELYNIISQKVVKILDYRKSLKRIQHATIKLGNSIWAFGGTNANNTTPAELAEFDPARDSWIEIDQKLHSTNTSEVLVIPYPVASIDCVPECQCGVAKKKQRIFGGSEAKVRAWRNCIRSLQFGLFSAKFLPLDSCPSSG